jgi:hypothetical protein
MERELTINKACELDAVVPDSELREWFNSGAGEPRELIVEVKHPLWQVAVSLRAPGNIRNVGVVNARFIGCEEQLRQLADFVTTISHEKPTMLKGAGALALRISGKEALQVARHQLVKTIRPNRLLK